VRTFGSGFPGCFQCHCFIQHGVQALGKCLRPLFIRFPACAALQARLRFRRPAPR
jgi:hypothetical protein